MKRRHFLKDIGVALVVTAASSALAQTSAKPNIVFLMAEDIGCDLACYGTKGVKTPTLDKLAAEGIRYTRFYTNSPICSPSRSALMSGMYQTSIGAHHHRSRVKAPEYVKPMTHYLRQAGYTSVLGSELVLDRGKKTDLNFFVNRRMLFDKGKKEPFFNQIQLKVTHRDAKSPRWAEIREKSLHPVDVNAIELPPYLPDHPEVRLDWATYLDTIEYMDREVSEIIAQLKRDGHLDNTIIIFIGDNGRCQIRGKGYLYEDGIRCPLIISGKGIEEGKVVDDLVSGVDLTATILALAGIEKPDHMQGQAFLKNPDYTPKEYVFAARDIWDEIKDCSRTVVGKRYKYIYNFMPEVPYDAGHGYLNNRRVRPILPLLRKMNEEGKLTPEQAYFFRPKKEVEQLYDLEKDPFELHNLANVPAYQDQKEALKKRLFSWIEKTHDMGLKKNAAGQWTTTLDDWKSKGRIWTKKDGRN